MRSMILFGRVYGRSHAIAGESRRAIFLTLTTKLMEYASHTDNDKTVSNRLTSLRRGNRHVPVPAVIQWFVPHGRCWDMKEPLMEGMLREYLPILVFLAVALALGLVLVLAAMVIAVRNPDPEKVSAYECGFNAFDDARMKFDVRFYLVSILFIIFDLEIAFLFPWAVAFGDLSMLAFWSMMVFLAVLTIGFAYEWKKGAMEWE